MSNLPSLGPLIVDIDGCTLTAADEELLSHPLVGGVILFSRNFQSAQQLFSLTTAIKALRSPRLLVMVDHEGGRVQRFRKEFTRIPPMAVLGNCYQENPQRALQWATGTGYLLASELIAVGIDLNLGPVLDIDYGASSVIADRSFAAEKAVVSELAAALIRGMQQAGMQAVGKHFPGHGAVTADSHCQLPYDNRLLATILQDDLHPYKQLLAQQQLAAVMTAHVVYECIDAVPATYSSVCLQQILRQQLGFTGVVISDDLFMAAATTIEQPVKRLTTALQAGCDLLLMCNHRPQVLELVQQCPAVTPQTPPAATRLYAQAPPAQGLAALHASVCWQENKRVFTEFLHHTRVQSA